MPNSLSNHHRSNDIVSGVLHAIGFGLAIAALVLMVIWASGGREVTAVSIFGAGLILLYLASATYHLFPPHHIRLKLFLRQLDHVMIYVLIAATYTPICLVTISGAWGWTIFGIGWGLAVLGICLTLIPKLHVPVWVAVLHYLCMGWLVVIALPVVLNATSLAGFSWLLAGGVAYTLGTVFFGGSFVWKIRGFGLHEVFHLWVMLGSFCHFWFVLWYI